MAFLLKLLKWVGGKLLLPALVLAGAFFAGRHVGTLQERIAWTKAKDVFNRQERARERGDDRRQATALGTQLDRIEARRPIIEYNTKVVHEFAQTDAGRVRCLAAERVLDIEATAVRLGLSTAAPAGEGGRAVHADAAAERP